MAIANLKSIIEKHYIVKWELKERHLRRYVKKRKDLHIMITPFCIRMDKYDMKVKWYKSLWMVEIFLDDAKDFHLQDEDIIEDIISFIEK